MSDAKSTAVDRAIKAGHVDPANRNSTDAAHAPISLPPASVDIAELEKGLDGALDKDRDEDKVQAAVDAATTYGTDHGVPGSMAGFKEVEVPHDEIEGLTETTLAFDREAADAAEAEAAQAEEARTEGAEAVSKAPAGDAPAPAPAAAEGEDAASRRR